MTAITRAVSEAMNRCELAFLAPQPMDIALASEQHRRYEDCLRRLGVRVVSLPAAPELPDSVFVEDPAVVLDEVAVVTRMAAAARRSEAESLAEALAPFRPLRRMRESATLEGGDVMRAGRRLYVGRSERTNAEGIRQLREAVEEFGYTVEVVDVRGCMHLKTGCCWLGEDRVLVNPAWIETEALAGFEVWPVPSEEPWGANVLVVNGAVLVAASAPGTRRLLESRGMRVEALEIGELMKAEAGLTCMSLLFQDHAFLADKEL